MRLTIHRGTHEIGGSCVELSAGEGRVVIDVGMPLVDEAGERFNADAIGGVPGPEMVSNGVLPDVAGLYPWETAADPPCGVLVSHAHLDHSGFLPFVRPEVPIYAGPGTQAIMGLPAVFGDATPNPSGYRSFESDRTFHCGPFTVTPYLMDHSAFDAHAFVVQADGQTLIYSGDFRAHGRKAKLLGHFLRNAPHEADALLLEGTTLGRADEPALTESQLEDAMVKVCKAGTGPVLVACAASNIDRLVTLYRAALRADRLLAIDVYTAHVLHTLAGFARLPHPSASYGALRVFYPYWLSRRIARAGNVETLYRFRPYKVTKGEVGAEPGRYIMLVRASMLTDLRRTSGLEGADFVYSLWSGYCADESMRRLLDFVAEKSMNMHTLHTSGHADLATLRRVVGTLQPRRLVPIHTFEPDAYGTLGMMPTVLQDGQELDLA